MIQIRNNLFILTTPHSAYAFRRMDTGHLEHIYYGPSLGNPDLLTESALEQCIDAMRERKEFAGGNMIEYDPDHPTLNLEDACLEISSYGKGDIREPFVEVVHADGSFTSDFLFEKAEIREQKSPLKTMPCAYSEDGCEQLAVTLWDAAYNLRLELLYSVFEDCDCITRSARILNAGGKPVRVKRLMSTMLDFADGAYQMSVFRGAWAREMERFAVPVRAGKFVNASYTGTSSSRANPFVILHKEETTERTGLCYGLNLIYSGNHYEACEVNAYGKTRLVTGINPASFSWLLDPGEEFESPEAVMSVTGRGFTRLSHQLHRFVREHIVRGYWKDRIRPVLLNSWEAAYFKFDEAKLLRMAKYAKEAGIELFVMDDGWFGERNDDTRSLGDWKANTRKLPGGIRRLSEKIAELGLDFGIWVEPEMVNTDSDLYRSHPEWVMAIPGLPHSEGRHQRMLDFANPEVVSYMTEQMRTVFRSGRISYVKWDMNRIMSDVYSPYLPAERQEETAHRYMLGVYRMMKTLTEEFPEILFEGCAAGGNRFDLGILCYFPQIWASDNTDALQRVHIQEGYSFGYPMSVIGAHVSSSPNHQTLRAMPLESRFAAAAFGILGYELNLADLSRAEFHKIKEQIRVYKEWREVLQKGDFYRGVNENTHEWTCVSEDQKKGVCMMFQELTVPNQIHTLFRPRGLDKTAQYTVYNIKTDLDIRQFGDLINTVSPVHIRQGSQLHNVMSRFVKMPGEQEMFLVPGAVLMRAGIQLSPAYAGTGFNEKTRCFQDFSSRLYFLEAQEAAD